MSNVLEMKTLITIVILFFSSISLKADYLPLDLYGMILGAEKIAFGEITELDTLTFTLKVERNLTGQETELEIDRFENWPCAHRWTNYKVGQHLFLFIVTRNGRLFSMGAGNEGELPIRNGLVYINSFSLDPPPPPRPDGKHNKTLEMDLIESNRYKLYGGNYFGHETILELFASTVKKIRNCFEISSGKYYQIKEVLIKCDEGDFDNEIENNKLLSWAYIELKKKSNSTENIKK